MTLSVTISIVCGGQHYVLRLDNPYDEDPEEVKRKFRASLTVGHDAADSLRMFHQANGVKVWLRPSLISAVGQ